jgi:hypothetical protein
MLYLLVLTELLLNPSLEFWDQSLMAMERSPVYVFSPLSFFLKAFQRSPIVAFGLLIARSPPSPRISSSSSSMPLNVPAGAAPAEASGNPDSCESNWYRIKGTEFLPLTMGERVGCS